MATPKAVADIAYVTNASGGFDGFLVSIRNLGIFLPTETSHRHSTFGRWDGYADDVDMDIVEPVEE